MQQKKNFQPVWLLCIVCMIPFLTGFLPGAEPAKKQWFPLYDFDAALFQTPAQEFGPFARWWWPGNDVTSDELRRQINVFADNAFGGVEIQPFRVGIPQAISEQQKARVYSWDTPSYYEHVRSVMDEARKRDLIVDMTNGSGWPSGGPYLKPEEGILTLLHTEMNIVGGTEIELPLPEPDNETGIAPELVAVLAVKAANRHSDTKTCLLDASATTVLTPNIQDLTLHWKAPEGEWKIIAFWNQLNSLTGAETATLIQGPVLDPFDSLFVVKNLEYLFGARTGLEQYYGNPLRAIFDDSYEYTVHRHYTKDFITAFKKRRGYDITPWLPANMQNKYNYPSFMNPNDPPYFAFGDEDWRLRYDYDKTVGELLGEHFIATERKWTEERGMLHRTQAYGLNMDLMDNAGKTSIPETETMLGAEATMKIMSSGAHLYNKPVVTAESSVYKLRGGMTTPQKLRIIADKLFVAGVNQIIYHGVSYPYYTDEAKTAKWFPFYISKRRNFSSNLGEGTIFWEYQKEVNEYIARSQYALRSGKPHADVLIYLPLTNVIGVPGNPEEFLATGELPDVEPESPVKTSAYGAVKSAWADKFYTAINQLEVNGITWEWVNEESLKAASLTAEKLIDIRGNTYQVLMLIDNEVLPVEAAKVIHTLSQQGMHLVNVGALPARQPSFLNWEENDMLVARTYTEALLHTNAQRLNSPADISGWADRLNRMVKYKDRYPFARQIQREMNDGSRIQFIWNKSENWQTMALEVDKKYKHAYWMNAEKGTITTAGNLDQLSYTLPPRSSIFLYLTTHQPVENNILRMAEPTLHNAQEMQRIENWSLTAGDVSIPNTLLFDWKLYQPLKYTSDRGCYKSTFALEKINDALVYLLDLGKVCFTADVTINGRATGRRIFAPYTFNVTPFLKEGINHIEVNVTPGELNGFIGEAEKGNPHYANYSGQPEHLMSAGLIGPVVLFAK